MFHGPSVRGRMTGERDAKLPSYLRKDDQVATGLPDNQFLCSIRRGMERNDDIGALHGVHDAADLGHFDKQERWPLRRRGGQRVVRGGPHPRMGLIHHGRGAAGQNCKTDLVALGHLDRDLKSQPEGCTNPDFVTGPNVPTGRSHRADA